MTFQGRVITGKPSLSLIENYIARKRLFCDAKDVYNYWEKKKWLTKKGKEVKTLEAAINVWNSIAVHRESKKKKGKIHNGETKESIEKLSKVKESPCENPYMPYKGQLLDERWFAFRRFVLKVRGEQCEACGKKNRLQIHHLKYKEKAMAWEYTCNEVVVLCSECHRKIHGLK